MLAVALAYPGAAATRTWVCQWANNNWGTATNWSPAGLPQNGDDLVFTPTGRFDSVNNLAAFRARTITITTGAEIHGNAFTVSNSVLWSGAVLSRVTAPILLGGPLAMTGVGASVRLGDIQLNGYDLVLSFDNNVEIEGGISGTGDVTKNGAGRLLLGGIGDNSFVGDFNHYGGELWAAKQPCFPGNFYSSAHTILYGSGVFSTNHSIVLLPGAFLESGNDYTNVCANLVLTGARIQTPQMRLAIRSNLTVQASATGSEIIAQLDLGNTQHNFQIANGAADPDLRLVAGALLGGASGGFTKTGAGSMRLIQTGGGYGGLTTISAGVVELGDLSALGSGAGKTVVQSNATLRLTGIPLTLNENLELYGDGVGGASGALQVTTGSSSMQGSITVPVGASIRCEGPFHVTGALLGAGDFRFNGPGEFWTQGGTANLATGDFIVESGAFVLNKTDGISANVANTIRVGTNGTSAAAATLRNFGNDQITGPVVVNSGSGWELLSGTFEGAPNVTLIGDAEIFCNGGTFQLDGTLTVLPLFYGSAARIYGGTAGFGSGATRTIDVQRPGGVFGDGGAELEITTSILGGSAPVLKTGPGDLRLSGQFGFTSLLTVQDGMVRTGSLTPLGGGGATVVANTGRLLLGGAQFDQEPLVINGGGGPDTGNVVIADSSGWRAPITLNAPLRAYPVAGETWTVNSPISGVGAFLVTGPGTVRFDWNTTNTYTGGTWVKDGELHLTRDVPNVAVPGALTIGDGVGAAGSARVTIAPPNAQIADSSDLYVFGDGRLILTNTPAVEIIRTLKGSGEIILTNATLRLNDGGNESVYAGTFRGNGDLIKAGAGTFVMDGVCRLDGGTLSMFGGTTAIDGIMDGAPNPTLIDAYSGTVLAGDGIVERVNVRSGATLSPGPGYERLTGDDVTLLPGANLFLEINGPVPGFGHDQLVVRNSLAVTNAFLTLAMQYAPAEGDVIMLVNNQSATPVRGTFSGRPQGSVFNENGTTFLLSYTGGDGNDITLTVTNTELALAAVWVTGGNADGRMSAGECSGLSVVLSNKSGLTLTGVAATLDALTPGVLVTRQQSGYPTFSPGSSRTNLAPFQISTSPDLECGNVVRLRLTVNAGSAGTFYIPVTLPLGTPGGVRSYAPLMLNSLSIPDQGGATSYVAVANFNARVAKATVSLHLAHTYVGDLNLTLRSPSGKSVRLAARRGSGADGYGTNCTPAAARTTFDDAAIVSIGAGQGSFVGSFRPEEPLAELMGDEGNGTWALVLEDEAASDTGGLLCWTLNLHPATCSGETAAPCESCLPPIGGSIRPQSPTLSDRLSRDGRPSICGEVKECPGLAGVAGAYRYSARLFTNNGPATCITVVMRTDCTNGGLFLSAYRSPFNPADLCANYLADAGASGPVSSMSFPVAANSIFTVVVNEITPGAGCSGYSLELHGLPCPPPVLHIAPAAPGQVRLFWNLAGGDGYAVQSATGFANGGASPFLNLPGTPVVVGNTFNVTNAANGDHRFYRLVK